MVYPEMDLSVILPSQPENRSYATIQSWAKVSIYLQVFKSSYHLKR